MHNLQTDLDGALEWISKKHDELAELFLSNFSVVRSFGDSRLDAEVTTYIDGLGNWVRANDSWAFEVISFLFLFQLSKLTPPFRVRDTLAPTDSVYRRSGWLHYCPNTMHCCPTLHTMEAGLFCSPWFIMLSFASLQCWG
jgi:hypothetical protein